MLSIFFLEFQPTMDNRPFPFFSQYLWGTAGTVGRLLTARGNKRETSYREHCESGPCHVCNGAWLLGRLCTLPTAGAPEKETELGNYFLLLFHLIPPLSHLFLSCYLEMVVGAVVAAVMRERLGKNHQNCLYTQISPPLTLLCLLFTP